MEQAQADIREQQRASWNKFSSGWKKWDDLTMDFLAPMGKEIIALLKLKGDEKVLDIAAGTGEPGLSIAEMLPSGKVYITDLSEDMLQIALENAGKRNIHNIEAIACDVCELPFADNTFDAISCRFGFMFFPDMQLAANEIARVLKPGGRVATSVWDGPEKNFWITAIGGTINKTLNITPPPAGAPGMFRCAAPGFVQELFRNAGLVNTSEKEVAGTLNAGTADTYWNMMTEVAAPFVSALSGTDAETRQQIKDEVFRLVNEKFHDSSVQISSGAIVVYGEKVH